MVIPVILSGGAGSRLWPISREAHPKPFMKLADGQTLLQKTFLRAAQLADVAEIMTITNREYYFKSKDEYEQTKLTNKAITTSFLLEPFARNTAPAIAFAALKATIAYSDEAILLVLAADHLIQDYSTFNKAYSDAVELAKAGKLVTFGITPTSPETGYGYIECGKAINDKNGYEVIRFAEKPNAETAQQYISTGRYLWNSGMFCFKASTLLEQLKEHAPELYQHALKCWEISTAKTNSCNSVIELNKESFDALEDISIDYALMEKSKDIAVIASKFDWDDIGSWDAVGRLVESDQHGNSVIGEAILVDVSNTFIQGEDRIIAAVGVSNLIIIDTPDALLVADRNRSQDVKHVVQRLKSMAHESYKVHRTVQRPWGSYTVLEEGEKFKMKRIIVKPQASLSLQMHHHRSEHWVVVSGSAKVVNGDKEILLNTNESTFIPAGHRHRLENPGVIELVLIEVQTGEYLGEDDIVRFEDKYGRA